MQDQYIRAAEIIKVVDGDTIDVRIDLGFRIATTQRLRLARLNAPERGEEGGKAATKALEEMLANYNNQATIRSIKTEKWGRWLAEVWVTDKAGEVNINNWLIENGHAKNS